MLPPFPLLPSLPSLFPRPAASRTGEVPPGRREPGRPEQVAGQGGARDRPAGRPLGGL